MTTKDHKSRINMENTILFATICIIGVFISKFVYGSTVTAGVFFANRYIDYKINKEDE